MCSRSANSACSAGSWALMPITLRQRLELGEAVAVGAALRGAARAPGMSSQPAGEGSPGCRCGDRRRRQVVPAPHPTGRSARCGPRGAAGREPLSPEGDRRHRRPRGRAGRPAASLKSVLTPPCSQEAWGGRKVARVERYAAFLRGMNLGDRRIKNDELRRRFEELGMSAVSCFRASGNVLFASEEGDEKKLKERLEAGLGKSLGYAVPVFLPQRRRAEGGFGRGALRPLSSSTFRRASSRIRISTCKARGKDSQAGARPLQRRRAPGCEGLRALLAAERWTSQSDLDLKVLESLLGAPTMRTKGTVEQIAAKCVGPDGR